MASGDTNDVNYWRWKAEDYKRLWEEEKEEFREFQQNSKELETELETQLELVEKNNAELQAKVERLSIQVETSNDKHDILVGKLNRQVTNLQEEVNTLKAEVFQQKQYIRQLEQVNDDLERSNRNALASVEDIEDRLNQVLEKNALLEVELYEKDELNVRVQRLKDEVRGEVPMFLIEGCLFTLFCSFLKNTGVPVEGLFHNVCSCRLPLVDVFVFVRGFIILPVLVICFSYLSFEIPPRLKSGTKSPFSCPSVPRKGHSTTGYS
ncbi:nuclear distribution protein nude 1 [Echinococcus multilocularis]|uniref:Nuclear distribution protein nude 1 n=1 Tax=Echinococcus multilocularis TaxID=6211 RepID=A0A068Y0G2_ECHMU|nr:nuclear distribution protein nude 1 [Echinococcus multilocularis]